MSLSQNGQLKEKGQKLNKNKNMSTKKLFRNKKYPLPCITPLPILRMINGVLAFILLIFAIALIISLIISLIKRKKDKALRNSLWLLPIIPYLSAFFFLESSEYSYYFYVGSLLILAIFLLISLFIGAKYKLIKTGIRFKILATIFIIFFISMSVISAIKIPVGYRLLKKEKETRNYFEKILNELPQPSETEKKVFHSSSAVSYYIPEDGNELVNFYKSNISLSRWQFLEEREGEYSQDLYYKKTDENIWLRLNFEWTSRNEVKIQGREYPFTYLTVYFYESDPTIITNPIPADIEMGPCDEQPLF